MKSQIKDAMANDHALYEQEVQSFFSSKGRLHFENGRCLFCPPNTQELDLFNKGTMTVTRCQCGLVYNSRQPTEGTLAEFYKESRAMTSWSEMKETSYETVKQKDKFGKAVGWAVENKIESLVDLGCGNGSFLSKLAFALPDADLLGVETNDRARIKAKEKGVETKSQTIGEFFKTNTKKWDAISLWGVLEHVKDPKEILRGALGHLRGSGHVIACVPNVESRAVRTLGKDCFTFCPQHLWYFSLATLDRLFKEEGFKREMHYTIESEVVPILKHEALIFPYQNVPEVFMAQYLEEKRLNKIEKQIFDQGEGYKIVAVYKAL